ncbi:MAG: hypothetical protein HQK60_00660 [Deltaproteobacteria bacterium]|nr:hypothetical protein [Deltaproteobacteria bacterium]
MAPFGGAAPRPGDGCQGYGRVFSVLASGVTANSPVRHEERKKNVRTI